MRLREAIANFCLESKIGHQCIQYGTLKQSIQAAIGENGEKKFVQLVTNELGRIKDFITLRLKDLRVSLRQMLCQKRPVLEPERSLGSRLHVLCMQRYIELTDNFVDDLKELAKFIYLSSEAFSKIIQKHDKIVGATSSWYFMQNHDYFFSQALSELDAVLYLVSTFYESARSETLKQDLDEISAEFEKQIDQNHFERKSAKYWVKLEDAFAVRAEIAKHLPIHMYNGNSRERKQLKRHISSDDSLTEHTLPPTTWVSSVYLDSADLTCYHKRVRLEEGATLIRLRWYNPPHGYESPTIAAPLDQIIYVEKKTHHESWIWESSVKERFSLPEDAVLRYMHGDRIQHVHEKSTLAKDIQAQIKRDDLHPVLRTVYKRTAFQLQDSNDVRITMDTDFTMIEEAGHVESGSEWKRQESEILDARDYRVFPFAILEVKLKVSPPPWLDNLLESSLIRPVPKFSKFQHSVATFCPRSVKEFPYWYNDDLIRKHNQIYSKVISHLGRMDSEAHEKDSADITSGESSSMSDVVSSNTSIAMTTESGKTPASFGIQTKENGLFHRHGLFSKFAKSDSAIEEKKFRAMQRLKVEPKTYFANERTFIQWLTSSLLLVTLSGALVTLGDNDAQITGLLFMPLAILILLYASVMFYLRLYRIKKNCKSGYHDAFGPAVLTIFLCAAMLATFCLHFRKYSTLFDQEEPEEKSFRLSFQESSRCHRLNLDFPIFFEPSDALLDPSGKFLWTCSGAVLAKIDLETEHVVEYIHVNEKIKYDFEGLSFGNAALPYILYIATEFPSNQILIYNLISRKILEVVEMKPLLGHDPSFEGIAYSDAPWITDYGVTGQTSGTFFATSKDYIQVFNLKPDTSSRRIEPIPLQSIQTDAKIGSLTVHNNTLYALLDNRRKLRAWDLGTAERRDYELPTASKEWEGIAFDFLNRNNVSTAASDEHVVYLSMDSPPQIWRLLFSEERGFLEC